jgi:hypothetical protein
VPEDETHPTGEAGEGLREHSDRYTRLGPFLFWPS